ncbi:MAG: methyltransferase domain-containing protein [Actinomycetota bacterium]
MTDDATRDSLKIWDALAPAYEQYRVFMKVTENPVTERMIAAMEAKPGDTILELTAGPGELGLTLAEDRPDVNVIISDFAPSMVSIAETNTKERRVSNVETRVIDAQAIDLPDASVDGVLSRYGLMLVPDVAKAFAEIRRVLKPGRTLAYAVWGPLETNPWMMMLGAVLMQRGHFTPPPGGGFFPLTKEEDNKAAASAAGFAHVEVETIDHPHEHPSFESYWELSTGCSGPLVPIVESLSEDERKAVRAQIEEYTASFRSGNGMSFPSRRLFVRAS